MKRYFKDYSFNVSPGQLWLCGMWEPHGWKVTNVPCQAIVFIIFPPLIARTHFGTIETSQLFHVQNPGGARRQLTFFPEPISDASMCPDSETEGFLFSKDVGGSEYYQIFYFDLEQGSYKMLSDGSSRNGGAKWSNKGDKFVFSWRQSHSGVSLELFDWAWYAG